MKNRIVLGIFIMSVVLFAGCQGGGSMVLGGYNTIDEAVLDTGLITEYELIDQVDFATAVVLSIVDQDKGNWTLTLYENNDKFYNYGMDFLDEIYFVDENGDYLLAHATKLRHPEGVIVEIGISDKIDKIVKDNCNNEYVRLETLDMNIYVMELDEVPEDYIIYVDGKEYTLG